MDILDAMTRFLIRDGLIDPDRSVTDWEEGTRYGGFCSTCYFEDQVVIFILDNGKKVTYNSDLGDLIRNLTD